MPALEVYDPGVDILRFPVPAFHCLEMQCTARRHTHTHTRHSSLQPQVLATAKSEILQESHRHVAVLAMLLFGSRRFRITLVLWLLRSIKK
jgi:hypothetical protein